MMRLIGFCMYLCLYVHIYTCVYIFFLLNQTKPTKHFGDTLPTQLPGHRVGVGKNEEVQLHDSYKQFFGNFKNCQ